MPRFFFPLCFFILFRSIPRFIRARAKQKVDPGVGSILKTKIMGEEQRRRRREGKTTVVTRPWGPASPQHERVEFNLLHLSFVHTLFCPFKLCSRQKNPGTEGGCGPAFGLSSEPGLVLCGGEKGSKRGEAIRKVAEVIIECMESLYGDFAEYAEALGRVTRLFSQDQ